MRNFAGSTFLYYNEQFCTNKSNETVTALDQHERLSKCPTVMKRAHRAASTLIYPNGETFPKIDSQQIVTPSEASTQKSADPIIFF